MFPSFGATARRCLGGMCRFYITNRYLQSKRRAFTSGIFISNGSTKKMVEKEDITHLLPKVGSIWQCQEDYVNGGLTPRSRVFPFAKEEVVMVLKVEPRPEISKKNLRDHWILIKLLLPELDPGIEYAYGRHPDASIATMHMRFTMWNHVFRLVK